MPFWAFNSNECLVRCGAIVPSLSIAFKLIFCYVYCVINYKLPFYCMSKKKHSQTRNTEVTHSSAEAAEYKIIGHDLSRVILLNVLYLAGLLIIYYTNQNSRYLEHFFSRVFHW